MPDQKRSIGLSLGADLCWPRCFEGIVARMQPRIPTADGEITFNIERVTIEPFNLRQPCRYNLVIDRVTHWYYPSREWLKKAILLDGVYVFNNPWSIQSMEKQTTYCAMIRLGLPIPETWMVPPKSYDPTPDLESTLRSYARLFDLAETGQQVGYPLYMKPYDGGGWKGVSRIENESALRAAYEQSGKLVMHLQQSIEGHDRFVRCIGLGPQFRLISYDPGAPLHDRYQIRSGFVDVDDRRCLENMTMTINSFFGWDFNSCEALHRDDTWYPIDFANACPDSQVTSLHFHFPWLVKANIRWALFCAATRRPMRLNLDWQPFFDIAAQNLPYEERLEAYARIGHERMETDRFREFCDRYLAHIDEVADEFFGSEEARLAIRSKVEALFPADEVDEFTELFWHRVQQWRAEEAHQSVS